MPTYRSLDVRVTDGYDQPLPEYGTRTLDRRHLSTCYIESKTDKPFRIVITPTAVPFPDHLVGSWAGKPSIHLAAVPVGH